MELVRFVFIQILNLFLTSHLIEKDNPNQTK